MARQLKPVYLGLLVTTVLFLVASYFFSMGLGLAAFFFTAGGQAASALSRQGLSVWLVYLPVAIPIRYTIGTGFLILWSLYALCFVAAWRFRKSLHRVLVETLSRPARNLLTNCLFALPIVAGMTLIAVIAIQSVQEISGIPTGQPSLPENPFEAFFALSYAPLVEEIGFRVFPIGILLAVFLFSVGKGAVVLFSWSQRLKLFLLALVLPDKAKKLLGLTTVSDHGIIGGISRWEWSIVIFSAAIFGLAHYVYGGGWQLGKITSAAAVGVALALMYLIYGAQAPILLHWFFNYHSAVFELTASLHPIVRPVNLVATAVTTILGVIGWLTVTVLGLLRIADRNRK